MLMLVVGVICWTCELWEGHRRVEYVQDLVGKIVWFGHLFGR